MFLRALLVLALTALGAHAQEDPAALVVRLSSDRLEDRDQAATALKALGDRAVPALEQGLGSADAEIRLRSNQLLHEVSAVSALIEDLRSDDVPGNARKARNGLLRRYDETVKSALMTAVRSDDAQQALEAAFILVNKGEAASVHRAAPQMLSQSIGMFARGEADGFHWVAAQVLLRLGDAAGPVAEAAAYRKALCGVSPAGLDGYVLQLAEMCRGLKHPFPAPLLRRYFLNLRDDTTSGNARSAERVIYSLREMAIPELKALLTDPDAQCRRIAAGLLLDLKVKDLTPAVMPVLGEMLGRDPRALPTLISFGPAAVPTLEDRIESSDPPTALRAAKGLALFDRARWWERAARIAVANLESDTFSGNAKEASELLLLLGSDALPVVRQALASDDEQVVVCAAIVLAAAGEKVPADRHVLDQMYRMAANRNGSDESGCLYQALASMPAIWPQLQERLTLAGADGRERAATLGTNLDQHRGLARPWLSVECRDIGELIRQR